MTPTPGITPSPTPVVTSSPIPPLTVAPTPTKVPTSTKTPTPTIEPALELTGECVITAEFPIHPLQAFRGIDRVPSGFDSVNTAGCTYTKPIESIRVELHRDGEIAFADTVTLSSPAVDVFFPFRGLSFGVVPADLEPGRYTRRMIATTTDGDTTMVAPNVMLVKDVHMHPEKTAREVIAENLDVVPGASSLVRFIPEEWTDSSLGCPKPGDQGTFILGWTLIFRVFSKDYEVHTDEVGSLAVFCGEVNR